MTRVLFFFISLFFVLPSPNLNAGDLRMSELGRLTDTDISPEGKTALNLSPNLVWKHAESEHFVYHFPELHKEKARIVFDNAENYYDWIKNFFGVNKDTWRKKSHVFIFTRKEDWSAFNARLSRETSAMQAYTNGWELFILRHEKDEWASHTLAHELTHLILFRFLQGTIPLFLNEGFAEFVAYEQYYLKNYPGRGTPKIVRKIPQEGFMRLSLLVDMNKYPNASKETVGRFYMESESLTRYLVRKYGGEKFYFLLREIAQGKSFRFLVKKIYNLDFDWLQSSFQDYATTGKLD